MGRLLTMPRTMKDCKEITQRSQALCKESADLQDLAAKAMQRSREALRLARTNKARLDREHVARRTKASMPAASGE